MMRFSKPLRTYVVCRAAVLLTISAFLVLTLAAASLALTAEEFYGNAQEIKDINAFAATCQSAHETGFWTSHLWKKANNGAGIKADKNWIKSGRPAVRKKSGESVGGKTVYRESYFRAYSSLDEFLADYRVKITRDYPLAAKHSDTMWGYFSSLQKGRNGSWATTQRYFEYMADKALRLAPKLLGTEWRAQLLEEYREARARGLLSKKEIVIVEKKLVAAGISTK
ncbi:MAG: glucosaminidase domain-containing protein [Synergistaceae bacterium]|nr:glucosaminidase domain-containing protein [Synergistaceae bacterium]